jgi:hypothetical protein
LQADWELITFQLNEIALLARAADAAFVIDQWVPLAGIVRG